MIATEFNVTSLPTKIIINKNGDIVFRLKSGSENSDLFAEELSMMIDNANSEN